MSVRIYIDTNIYLNSILNRDKGISKEIFSFLAGVDVELYLNRLLAKLNLKPSYSYQN
jgi:predicted nucleic acid-binding protein